MKKRNVVPLSVLFSILLIFSTSVYAAFNYSGGLSLNGTPDGYLTGTGDWQAIGPTTLNWTVSWDGVSPLVHYSYTFSVQHHAASYFILEASNNFTSSDISNVSGDITGWSINTFVPNPDNTGGQYQTMPESIYGIKFDLNTSPDNPVPVTISFDSTRLPEWGDFYSRCGVRPEHQNGTKQWNSAWNVGFTVNDTDPTVAASSGSVQNHVLVPNTVAVVPEPVSSVLFITGGIMFAGRRYLRKRNK